MYSKNPFNFSGEIEDLSYSLLEDVSGEADVRDAMRSIMFKAVVTFGVGYVGGLLAYQIIDRIRKK